MMPRAFEITTSGVRIAGLDYGPRDSRPVLVLHGMRDHAWSMDPISRALAGRFRVVAPHLRGHGDSAKPGSYTMVEFLGDLYAVVQALKLQDPVLMGHSLGGHIVAQYAGIFDDVPAALIVVEGLGPPRPPGRQAPARRRALLRERIARLQTPNGSRDPLPDLEAAIERLRSRNPLLAPDHAHLLALHGTEPHPEGGLRWKWAPEAPSVFSSFSPEEGEERWSWVRCPTLIVTAGRSAAYWTRRGLSEPIPPERFQAELDRKLALFPSPEHAVVEGAGHMVHYDRPDALVACVRDFLERRLGPAGGRASGLGRGS